MADRLHDFQRDGLFRQQSQGPVGESFGRWPQSQSDDLGFLIAVQDLSPNSTLRVATERDLKPLRHEPLPNVLYSLRATVERFGNLSVGPNWSIRIRLKPEVPGRFLP